MVDFSSISLPGLRDAPRAGQTISRWVFEGFFLKTLVLKSVDGVRRIALICMVGSIQAVEDPGRRKRQTKGKLALCLN